MLGKRQCYKCINEDLTWDSKICTKCRKGISHFKSNGYKSKRHINVIKFLVVIALVGIFLAAVGHADKLIDLYWDLGWWK